MKQRAWFFTAAVATALTLTGCILPERQYEERVRFYYAREAVYEDGEELSADVQAQRFAPVAALNASIDELAEEGFELYKIEPLAGRERATKLIFRRELPPGWEKNTPAPLELSGLYMARGTEALPFYYFLEPAPEGYQVHVLGPFGPETHLAFWSDGQLRWAEGKQENRIEMGDTGDYIVHTIVDTDKIGEPHAADRIEARRVEPGE